MKALFSLPVIMIVALGFLGTSHAALMYDFQSPGPDAPILPFLDDGGTITLNASVPSPDNVHTTAVGLGNSGGASPLVNVGETLTLSFADGVNRILQSVTFAGLGTPGFLEEFTLSANGALVDVTTLNPIPVSGLIDFTLLGGVVGNTFDFGSVFIGGGSSYRIAKATFAPVPAPSVVFLMATGLAGFVAWRSRKTDTH